MGDVNKAIWSAEQAIALLCTGDRAFATSVGDSSTVLATYFISERHVEVAPILRGFDDAEAELFRAMQRGGVSVHGLVRHDNGHGAEAPDQIPADHLRGARFDEHDDHDTLYSDELRTRWIRLRFDPDEIELLFASLLPEAAVETRRAAWAKEREAAFLTLSDAVRLVMERCYPDGSELAVIAHRKDWDALTSPEAIRKEHGGLGELYQAARAAWADATATMIQKFQEAGLAVLAKPSIDPWEWSLEAPDWWNSSHGDTKKIRVERAALEAAFEIVSPASSPEIPGETSMPELPAMTIPEPKAMPRKRGRKFSRDWLPFEAEAKRLLEEWSIPFESLNESKLADKMGQWFIDIYGDQPVTSTIKKHLKPVIKTFYPTISGNSDKCDN